MAVFQSPVGGRAGHEQADQHPATERRAALRALNLRQREREHRDRQYANEHLEAVSTVQAVERPAERERRSTEQQRPSIDRREREKAAEVAGGQTF